MYRQKNNNYIFSHKEQKYLGFFFKLIKTVLKSVINSAQVQRTEQVS